MTQLGNILAPMSGDLILIPEAHTFEKEKTDFCK